jgi:transaldolase/glucose-6-phosphate isomerase
MLDEGRPVWQGDGIRLFSSSEVNGNTLTDVLKDFLSSAEPGGYVAINAYLPRNEDMIDALQQMRAAIRSKTGNAVTAGFGPRFQHSTGQFHKGGPDNALFIVLTAEPDADFEVPTQGLTFGTLIRAQALGDTEALIEAGRKVLRIHLPAVSYLDVILSALG